jgi:hypothetical protein
VFDGRQSVVHGITLTVLLVFATELVPISTLGTLRSREIFGLSFLVAHELSLILAPPALANVLVIALKLRRSGYFAAAAATCLAIFLVFLQIEIF